MTNENPPPEASPGAFLVQIQPEAGDPWQTSSITRNQDEATTTAKTLLDNGECVAVRVLETVTDPETGKQSFDQIYENEMLFGMDWERAPTGVPQAGPRGGQKGVGTADQEPFPGHDPEHYPEHFPDRRKPPEDGGKSEEAGWERSSFKSVRQFVVIALFASLIGLLGFVSYGLVWSETFDPKAMVAEVNKFLVLIGAAMAPPQKVSAPLDPPPTGAWTSACQGTFADGRSNCTASYDGDGLHIDLIKTRTGVRFIVAGETGITPASVKVAVPWGLSASFDCGNGTSPGNCVVEPTQGGGANLVKTLHQLSTSHRADLTLEGKAERADFAISNKGFEDAFQWFLIEIPK